MDETPPAAIHERRRVKRASRNRATQLDVPAFGDWEFLQYDHVPITQYFDYRHSPTPRAAVYPYHPAYFTPADALFLHYDDFQQHYFKSPFRTPIVDQNVDWERRGERKAVKRECGTRRRRKRIQQRRSCLENKNRVFDFDTTETLTETQTTRTPSTERSNDAVCGQAVMKSKSKSNVKAKDEDLYKIPPELLRNSKPKKKMSKFISKCFVTICASY